MLLLSFNFPGVLDFVAASKESQRKTSQNSQFKPISPHPTPSSKFYTPPLIGPIIPTQILRICSLSLTRDWNIAAGIWAETWLLVMALGRHLALKNWFAEIFKPRSIILCQVKFTSCVSPFKSWNIEDTTPQHRKWDWIQYMPKWQGCSQVPRVSKCADNRDFFSYNLIIFLSISLIFFLM